jgi:hypothetical protein
MLASINEYQRIRGRLHISYIHAHVCVLCYPYPRAHPLAQNESTFDTRLLQPHRGGQKEGTEAAGSGGGGEGRTQVYEDRAVASSMYALLDNRGLMYSR